MSASGAAEVYKRLVFRKPIFILSVASLVGIVFDHFAQCTEATLSKFKAKLTDHAINHFNSAG